ncbi:hypothetical protein VNO77_23752 [Canavalia gladiata]|uniref:USP domain-containing protein n=1 Tax=Canavalia gladiata TaxID=3824 RepID=A0AAN9QBZ9_CANGL
MNWFLPQMDDEDSDQSIVVDTLGFKEEMGDASVSSMDAELPHGGGIYQLIGIVSHSGTSALCGHYVAHGPCRYDAGEGEKGLRWPD